MSVILNRLDSRLAHGMVCTTIVPGLGITHILVVDDVKCKDPFLVRLYEKAAPTGCKVETINTDELVSRFQGGKLEEGRILILFGDIEHSVKAYEKGYTYSELQIANISMPFGKTKKIMAAKGVAMDREDGEQLKALQDKGVKVYFQAVLQDSPRSLADVLAKAKFKK